MKAILRYWRLTLRHSWLFLFPVSLLLLLIIYHPAHRSAEAVLDWWRRSTCVLFLLSSISLVAILRRVPNSTIFTSGASIPAFERAYFGFALCLIISFYAVVGVIQTVAHSGLPGRVALETFFLSSLGAAVTVLYLYVSILTGALKPDLKWADYFRRPALLVVFVAVLVTIYYGPSVYVDLAQDIPSLTAASLLCFLVVATVALMRIAPRRAARRLAAPRAEGSFPEGIGRNRVLLAVARRIAGTCLFSCPWARAAVAYVTVHGGRYVILGAVLIVSQLILVAAALLFSDVAHEPQDLFEFPLLVSFLAPFFCEIAGFTRAQPEATKRKVTWDFPVLPISRRSGFQRSVLVALGVTGFYILFYCELLALLSGVVESVPFYGYVTAAILALAFYPLGFIVHRAGFFAIPILFAVWFLPLLLMARFAGTDAGYAAALAITFAVGLVLWQIFYVSEKTLFDSGDLR